MLSYPNREGALIATGQSGIPEHILTLKEKQVAGPGASLEKAVESKRNASRPTSSQLLSTEP